VVLDTVGRLKVERGWISAEAAPSSRIGRITTAYTGCGPPRRNSVQPTPMRTNPVVTSRGVPKRSMNAPTLPEERATNAPEGGP
jgi:hypothetical protein